MVTALDPEQFPRLRALGWDASWAHAFAEHAALGREPARVAIRHKDQYLLVAEDGERRARIKGRLRYDAEEWADLPLVGDWVAVARAPREEFWRIHHRLDRRSAVVRKVKGDASARQVLAANVDLVFVVMGLTEDYNPRRLERYLVIVREGGARPVVLLNKVDLVDPETLAESLEEIGEAAGDAPVAPISALRGDGVREVAALVRPGVSVMLAGSSGAGKSTLVNALFGEERALVAPVRERDGRGRHTTTQREMMFLPGGGILIDSPGLREIQLMPADEGVDETFDDILELAKECRFRDCGHDGEPGCAVEEALDDGRLDPARLESWRRLQQEAGAARVRKEREADRPRRAFREMQQRRKRRR